MKQCMFTKCMWWLFYGASKIILLYNLNLYSPVCQLDLNTTRRTKSKENLKKKKIPFYFHTPSEKTTVLTKIFI